MSGRSGVASVADVSGVGATVVTDVEGQEEEPTGPPGTGPTPYEPLPSVSSSKLLPYRSRGDDREEVDEGGHARSAPAAAAAVFGANGNGGILPRCRRVSSAAARLVASSPTS